MKPSGRTMVIIGAIVFVIIVAVGIYFYTRGKKTVTIQPPPMDDPNSTGADNNPGGVGSASILKLVGELYAAMKGVNVDTDVTPFNDLMELSDTDFVNVYNTFNSKYQKDSGETLYEWVYNEKAGWFSDFGAVKKSVLNRMKRLNLL